MIFMVFFLVLYGIITYGMIFTAQQSLNLAAQDGARKALQWQPDIAARAAAARSTALDRTGWISAASDDGALSVVVCYQGGSASSLCREPQKGQIEVVVSYLYGEHPIIPRLPVFGDVMTPAVLRARALVRLSDIDLPEGA